MASITLPFAALLAAATSTTTKASSSSTSSLYFLLFLGAIGFAFYYFMIKPQRRRMQQQQQVSRAASIGDEVMTTSGIYGVVIEEHDDRVTIESGPGTKLIVTRAAISGRVQAAPIPDSPGERLDAEEDLGSGEEAGEGDAGEPDGDGGEAPEGER